MIPDVQEHVTALAGLLTANGAGQVYDHVPEEPMVPCFIIQGAEDVIEHDDEATYAGEYLVNLDVVLLVELDDEHDNRDATLALWSALRVLAAGLAASGGDYWLERLAQPGTLQTTYWQHHGVTATVRTRT